jgi:hypothetical protein
MKLAADSLSKCFKPLSCVLSRTRWALSNSIIRFCISKNMCLKNSKYCFFLPWDIGDHEKNSFCKSSKSMLQACAKENMKIIVRAIENLSILSDWAGPVALGAHSWMNCIWNYLHDLQCAKVKNQYFEFFRYIFCDLGNLIILFNRARRFLLGTQERRFKHLLDES